MTNRTTSRRELPLAGLVSIGLLAGIASSARAQAVHTACYVPAVGAVYLILKTGLPTACFSGHVQITWTDGTIADNAVTSAKIADGAVNTADLANGAVTASKLASGVLGWEMITNSLVVAANTTASITANCSSGKDVLGGGFDVGLSLTTVLTARPIPRSNLPPFFLAARFSMTARTGGVGDTFVVYAICANT